ncbi:MAG: response regulator [Elusimicrobia bacterium]|nr:response regulator [Elusimicrobiota bacterium]MDE2512131.1 response regulator [Elusimicrobiota bacterium]
MRGASILAVDDERTSIEVLSRFFALKGHRVTGAGSAEEAAELLGRESFDFILMDIVLPGRSGLQALADFRKLTPAPIYIMSGDNDEEARRDALLLGASGFFGKPLDLGEIAAALDAL